MNPWAIIITFLLCSPALAMEKIQLDFIYNSSNHDAASSKAVVQDGESVESQYGRGDIDTVISMTPSVEVKNGQKQILVDIMIKNYREGDLISESNPQIITTPGKKAHISMNDSELEEDYRISVTAKTIR